MQYYGSIFLFGQVVESHFARFCLVQFALGGQIARRAKDKTILLRSGLTLGEGVLLFFAGVDPQCSFS